jgi:hypothetical protein
MADRGHYGERLSACDSGHPSCGVIEGRCRIDIAVTVDVSRKFVSARSPDKAEVSGSSPLRPTTNDHLKRENAGDRTCPEPAKGAHNR